MVILTLSLKQQNARVFSSCDAAEHIPSFKSSALDSPAHVKSPLAMLVQRLELKSKKYCFFIVASDNDIDTTWSELLAVDSALSKDESLTGMSISSKHQPF